MFGRYVGQVEIWNFEILPLERLVTQRFLFGFKLLFSCCQLMIGNRFRNSSFSAILKLSPRCVANPSHLHPVWRRWWLPCLCLGDHTRFLGRPLAAPGLIQGLTWYVPPLSRARVLNMSQKRVWAWLRTGRTLGINLRNIYRFQCIGLQEMREQ